MKLVGMKSSEEGFKRGSWGFPNAFSLLAGSFHIDTILDLCVEFFFWDFDGLRVFAAVPAEVTEDALAFLSVIEALVFAVYDDTFLWLDAKFCDAKESILCQQQAQDLLQQSYQNDW